MIRIVARRLTMAAPILLIVSFGVFALISLVPGDAARRLAGGDQASAEQVAAIRRELHLDESVIEQYWRWLSHAVRFDFGDSLFRRTAVIDDLTSRVPVTLGLVGVALVIGLLIGMPLGLASGLRPGGLVDGSARFMTSLGIAMPSFWLGSLLVVAFAVQRQWLPPSGFTRFSDSPTEWLRYMVLPGITLGAHLAAVVARQLRAGLITALNAPSVRTAWAMGGSRRTVIGKHALKGAAGPTVTALALQVGTLLGGAVIVEQIFSIPGLGGYLLEAILYADIPAVQGVVLVFVVGQVTISLLVDLVYGMLDPRVRVT